MRHYEVIEYHSHRGDRTVTGYETLKEAATAYKKVLKDRPAGVLKASLDAVEMFDGIETRRDTLCAEHVAGASA